ncbi:MAG TPA: ABC transporter ATP-binding protein [Casimicrobiaceae bacterium]|nr:ABC transporter ATP-binding protein [Casimicrobiaceae bacterium]
MLSIESLRSGYTSIDVLKGITLEVPDNAIVGVLGPNGAGKTALLRAISGLNPVREGRIEFAGRDLAGASPDAVVRSGVIHVPQGRMLFGAMSVRENLELGAYLQHDRHKVAKRRADVYALFPVLQQRSAQPAAYLSGGEQQMLALGRALMAWPSLLLLDEPSLGLAPKVFDTILEHVKGIHAAGASVLIAEQNARKVLRVAQHCYVLENGNVAFDGAARDLMRDPRIAQTYLGAGS